MCKKWQENQKLRSMIRGGWDSGRGLVGICGVFLLRRSNLAADNPCADQADYDSEPLFGDVHATGRHAELRFVYFIGVGHNSFDPPGRTDWDGIALLVVQCRRRPWTSETVGALRAPPQDPEYLFGRATLPKSGSP